MTTTAKGRIVIIAGDNLTDRRIDNLGRARWLECWLSASGKLYEANLYSDGPEYDRRFVVNVAGELAPAGDPTEGMFLPDDGELERIGLAVPA